MRHSPTQEAAEKDSDSESKHACLHHSSWIPGSKSYAQIEIDEKG